MATKARPSFTDSKGRLWCPRVDCRVVMEFERSTGRGLFQDVFEALSASGPVNDEKALAFSQIQIAKIGMRIFGHVGNIMLILYEGCRPSPGGEPEAFVPTDPMMKREKVSYADFCSSVGQEQIGAAMLTAIKALLDFFPDLSKEQQKEEAEVEAEDTSLPFEQSEASPPPQEPPGPGGTSTSSPPTET